MVKGKQEDPAETQEKGQDEGKNEEQTEGKRRNWRRGRSSEFKFVFEPRKSA